MLRCPVVFAGKVAIGFAGQRDLELAVLGNVALVRVEDQLPVRRILQPADIPIDLPARVCAREIATEISDNREFAAVLCNSRRYGCEAGCTRDGSSPFDEISSFHVDLRINSIGLDNRRK